MDATPLDARRQAPVRGVHAHRQRVPQLPGRERQAPAPGARRDDRARVERLGRVVRVRAVKPLDERPLGAEERAAADDEPAADAFSIAGYRPKDLLEDARGEVAVLAD